MSRRISEPDLVIPALFCIQNTGEISTSALIDCLRSILKPQGEELEILSGRNDDRFSQKVRNLRSHETLERDGLAIYRSQGNQGYWRITDRGIKFLEANIEALEYLIEQGYPYTVQQEAFRSLHAASNNNQEASLLDETIELSDIEIVEGKRKEVKQRIYERSSKLREFAVQHYSRGGLIKCAVCGFEFGAFYGEHGKGYIEIHHVKPVFSYEDDELEKTLEEALENVVPVCSNCHRMIHRKRDRMLTVDELRQIIADAVDDD